MIPEHTNWLSGAQKVDERVKTTEKAFGQNMGAEDRDDKGMKGLFNRLKGHKDEIKDSDDKVSQISGGDDWRSKKALKAPKFDEVSTNSKDIRDRDRKRREKDRKNDQKRDSKFG